MRYSFIILFLLLTSAITLTKAQDLKVIKLPDPDKTGGKPLMQILASRQSSREFSKEPLTAQQLSNLLWSAFGINRTESGKRTAPSARNWQEIDIYVTTADGTYLYDAKTHSLKQILEEDIRALTGKQDYVKDAAINLIYVADMSKLGDVSEEDKSFYSGADTGFIAENAYLYCTSENLAVVVRAMIDRDKLAKKLNLRSEQRITLGQTIGNHK
ncbi:MAG: SagB/ThcOx family dehydrogenase [Bacteroidota bacterium]|nr:SagB/ThcOx family dehydrogenase [Bacteroidota bacterium]MDP4189937.1 SagB/ThcOx family dehydrogenase [Bacteroidota bacterium]MDP4194506.1 SagB/ThcOx family dehydrogenase [Bacteroidota bacterium]